jgi:hypothetical protein
MARRLGGLSQTHVSRGWSTGAHLHDVGVHMVPVQQVGSRSRGSVRLLPGCGRWAVATEVGRARKFGLRAFLHEQLTWLRTSATNRSATASPAPRVRRRLNRVLTVVPAWSA